MKHILGLCEHVHHINIVPLIIMAVILTAIILKTKANEESTRL